jgi:hypothetical protein
MFNACETVIKDHSRNFDETFIHGNEKVLIDLTFPKVMAANTVKFHIYNEGSE